MHGREEAFLFPFYNNHNNNILATMQVLEIFGFPNAGIVPVCEAVPPCLYPAVLYCMVNSEKRQFLSHGEPVET